MQFCGPCNQSFDAVNMNFGYHVQHWPFEGTLLVVLETTFEQSPGVRKWSPGPLTSTVLMLFFYTFFITYYLWQAALAPIGPI